MASGKQQRGKVGDTPIRGTSLLSGESALPWRSRCLRLAPGRLARVWLRPSLWCPVQRSQIGTDRTRRFEGWRWTRSTPTRSTRVSGGRPQRRQRRTLVDTQTLRPTHRGKSPHAVRPAVRLPFCRNWCRLPSSPPAKDAESPTRRETWIGPASAKSPSGHTNYPSYTPWERSHVTAVFGLVAARKGRAQRAPGLPQPRWTGHRQRDGTGVARLPGRWKHRSRGRACPVPCRVAKAPDTGWDKPAPTTRREEDGLRGMFHATSMANRQDECRVPLAGAPNGLPVRARLPTACRTASLCVQ